MINDVMFWRIFDKNKKNKKFILQKNPHALFHRQNLVFPSTLVLYIFVLFLQEFFIYADKIGKLLN